MNLFGLAMVAGIMLFSAVGGGISGDVVTDNPVMISEKTINKNVEQDPFVGVWHSTKSILNGFADADIYISVNENGNMRVWGVANAPELGYVDYHYNIYLNWKHNGGTSYAAFNDEKILNFQCDGEKTIVSGNPYKLGFSQLEFVNFDVDLEFEKIKFLGFPK